MRVVVADVGEALFVRSAAARYVRVSVRASGEVRVSVPAGVSMEQAVAFVASKSGWVRRARGRLAARVGGGRTVFTRDTVFCTQRRRLALLPWRSSQFRLQLTRDEIRIFFPQDADLLTDGAQAAVRELIVCALRREAAECLPERVAELAGLHGLVFCGVTVKDVRTRWGSCSVSNHINLNIHLVRLPLHLSDYVILHELAHTVHRHHGREFWAFLDVLAGGRARWLAAELRQSGVAEF